MTIQAIPKRFKFARGATLLFFVLSIIFLVYTFYRSELVYSGQWHEKYLKYYLFSLAGLFFWSLVLKLKDEIKLNITMATTSMILMIYLVEVILSYKISFKYYDTRTGYEVYTDLRKEKIDAVPAIKGQFFWKSNGLRGSDPLFPLGGVSKKTTVFCNENGKYAIYQSDRFGFNNPDSVWDSLKTESVLVGDSFTHGACVEPGEDIAGQIRLKTGQNAINLGIAGNGPLMAMAALKEYAEFKKPKNVLWLYYEGNDLRDLQNEKITPLLMNYLQPKFTQHLIQRQVEIDKKLEKYIKSELAKIQNSSSDTTASEVFELHGLGHRLLNMTRILRLFHIRVRLGLDKQDHIKPRPFEYIDPLFTAILRQAKEISHSWGGQLYFIYLPHRARYLKPMKDHETYYNRLDVIDIASSLDIPIVDIHKEVFAKQEYPLSLYSLVNNMGAHYNNIGYSAVAEAIVSKVRKSTTESNNSMLDQVIAK
jgi:hypothetical protein